MGKIEFHFISWKKLHDLCFELLKKIKKEKLEFDRVVCISRGGLVVSRIFSDFLDLPISNFTIVSYVSVGKIGKPKVMEALAAEGWVDFQAHGVIHNTPISNNSTDEYILNELQGSITAIQEHFNKQPIAIIWPGGGFTPRAAQLARQSGYRLGFTINSRGPVMFNWIPLAVQKDPDYPIPIPEGPVGDPLMVLPRYWPSQVLSVLDEVRIMGKEAAAYAEQNRQVEFEFYEILCADIYGPIK